MLDRYRVQLSENVMVSVVQWEEEKFEIGILTNWYPNLEPNLWEMDYSEFPDVFTCSSQMEVYGIVTYLIKPAYEI